MPKINSGAPLSEKVKAVNLKETESAFTYIRVAELYDQNKGRAVL